jgi:vanillate O-demethylase ferredoxin subunit
LTQIKVPVAFSPPTDAMSAFPAVQSPQLLPLEVRSVTRAADGVLAIELTRGHGTELPAFTAGAHLDVHLPAVGLVRQYSICSDPRDRSRYVVAVALDAASRGGSRHIHEQVRAGQVLDVSVPRNHFPLHEGAQASMFIAGGIGVTPLLAMARRLSVLGRPWTLYLCARTPERAAFLSDLLALPHGRVVPVFDGMAGVSPLALAEVVRTAAAGTHFYCCGPAPLMHAFQEATRAVDPQRVHTEYFAAPAATEAANDAGSGGSFPVRLQRSGRRLVVGAGESLLEVLEREGLHVASSCRDGICGTCEVRVLAGTPDHRDFILSDAERARGDRMLPCVSRCGGELVLDL